MEVPAFFVWRMLKADIKFANGKVFTCVGRVGREGVTIPWVDEADLKAHIKLINDKNPDLPNPVTIERIYNEG